MVAIKNANDRTRVQESNTPLGVIPADRDPQTGILRQGIEFKPEELLRAFKQANPEVWTIKDKKVCPPTLV